MNKLDSNKNTLSVAQVILRIGIIISIVELIIMLGLENVSQKLSSPVVVALDVVVLVVLSTPVIYLWVIKPFSDAHHNVMNNLEDMAFSDSLTGLPNRRLLVDSLEKLKAECRRHNFHAAVLLIDLDGFKMINDNYGHEAGDVVLQNVAKTLVKNIRLEDMAARIGGDEFIILLNYLNTDFEQAKQEAKNKALIIQQALKQNIEFEGSQLSVGASFGVRMMCAEQVAEIGVEAIIREADVSMYHAKKSGEGKVVLFEGKDSCGEP